MIADNDSNNASSPSDDDIGNGGDKDGVDGDGDSGGNDDGDDGVMMMS